jgi:hypothetical protein
MQVTLASGRVVDIGDRDPKEFINSLNKRALGGGKSTSETGALDSLGEFFLKGPAAGLIKTTEGLATLAATPLEAMLDDPGIVDRTRKFYDKITPEINTGMGKFSEMLVQFALPGSIAAKIAKARGIGTLGQAGAVTAADFAVATHDVESMASTFFDIEPLKPTDTEDLEGVEKAAAELGNRLKVAGEGAALILGLPPLLKGVGAVGGAGVTSLARTDFAKNIAQSNVLKGLREMNSPLGGVQKADDLTKPGKVRKLWNKYMTFQGELPSRAVAEAKASQLFEANLVDNQLAKNFDEVDRGFKILSRSGATNNTLEEEAIDALNNSLFSKSDAVRENGLNSLKELDEKIGSLYKATDTKRVSLFDAATNIKEQIKEQSIMLTDQTKLKLLGDDEFYQNLRETINAQMEYYGTRAYRSLRDPDYIPSAEKTSAAKDELKTLLLKEGRTPGSELNAEINTILRNMLSRKNFGAKGMETRMQFDEDVLYSAAQGPLKGKKLDNLPAVREFLGEYTGDSLVRAKKADGTYYTTNRPLDERKEGLLTKVQETIEGQSKIITKGRYFKRIDDFNNALPVNSKFLKNADEIGDDLADWAQIGSDSKGDKLKFGSLNGKWARTEHVRAFQDIPGIFDSLSQNKLYATLLGVKGISQMAKTVYSPITQIRNATTASFFALANGNFGRGQDLVDSARLVFNNTFDKYRLSDKAGITGPNSGLNKIELDKEFNEYIELGLVDSGARKGEWEDLIKDAGSSYLGNAKVFNRKIIDLASSRKSTFANKLYQGSDDVWKIYSYKMEKGRLEAILKADPNAKIPATDVRNITDFGLDVDVRQLDDEAKELFLKREATAIVKDTVPNYSRVPLLIQNIRRIPIVGNFIAFPAEILRTGSNILGRSVKELASESAAVRSVGMRRLVGLSAVTGGLNTGLYGAGLALTGVDNEQVNAYKRSFAAPWDRNSVLIPVGSDKDGNITELYNFSYTNPYDYLKRPISGLWNAVNNGVTSEQELGEITLNALTESTSEFFSPFFGEAMVAEKTFDILRNRTQFDRPIVNEADPFNLKFAKRFAHVAEALTPGVSPGEFAASTDTILSGTGIPLVEYVDFNFKDFPKSVGLAFGMDPSSLRNRRGERLNTAGTFAESLSGLKVLKPQIENTLYYRGVEASDNVRQAARIFNTVARSRSPKSAEDMTKAYVLSNEQRFKALRDLSMAIEDARALGLSDSEIAKPLKRAKTPKYEKVMRGQFVPFFPSKETILQAQQETAMKAANPIDMSMITSEASQMYGQKFPDTAPNQIPRITTSTDSSLFEAPEPIKLPSRKSMFNRQSDDALRQIEINKLMGIR